MAAEGRRLSTLTIHDLEARELMILREEMENRAKSPVITWLLWGFLGGLGGHRYYLGNIVRAIFMTLTLGGFGVWALLDAFFIPGAIKKNRRGTEDEVLLEIEAVRRRGSQSGPS